MASAVFYSPANWETFILSYSIGLKRNVTYWLNANKSLAYNVNTYSEGWKNQKANEGGRMRHISTIKPYKLAC
jgi:hypothetical protein